MSSKQRHQWMLHSSLMMAQAAAAAARDLGIKQVCVTFMFYFTIPHVHTLTLTHTLLADRPSKRAKRDKRTKAEKATEKAIEAFVKYQKEAEEKLISGVRR